MPTHPRGGAHTRTRARPRTCALLAVLWETTQRSARVYTHASVRPLFVPRHALRDRVARAVFVRIMRRKDEGLDFGGRGSFGDAKAVLGRGRRCPRVTKGLPETLHLFSNISTNASDRSVWPTKWVGDVACQRQKKRRCKRRSSDQGPRLCVATELAAGARCLLPCRKNG